MKRELRKAGALRQVCPKCGAAPLSPCIGSSRGGIERKQFHAERYEALKMALAFGTKKSTRKDGPEWALQRARVFAAKGSKCFYCGADASHVDHQIPRFRGGSDEMDNLVPCCAACNRAKGSLTAEEWLR